MASVRDILNKKGHSLFTITPEATVFEAAVLMNEHKVGCVLVAADERLVGIFTERDILQRVVAQRLNADSIQVQEVMTTEVVCARPHTSIDEARGVMKDRRIRHLPVVDDSGRLHGMISIGDLNAFDSHSQEQTIHLLHQYIYGQV